MSMIGYIYTGAGSQYVGAGRKVYDSTWAMRKFFDRVDKRYHDFKINKLSFLGPQEELLKEENGVIINSVYEAGLYEVLKERKITPEQAAGYKSGELMALVGASSVDFDGAVDFLFKKRELIKEETGKAPFTHIEVNSVPIAKTEQVVSGISKQFKCNVTAYNSADSAVVALETGVKNKAFEIFKKLNGAVRELPGEETTGFPFLEPVKEKLLKEFGGLKIDRPAHRILCQTTGNYYENTQDISSCFADYITKPVRLDRIIETMIKNAVNTFVEIGCGSRAQRLVKKADSGKRALGTHDLSALSLTVKLAN